MKEGFVVWRANGWIFVSSHPPLYEQLGSFNVECERTVMPANATMQQILLCQCN